MVKLLKKNWMFHASFNTWVIECCARNFRQAEYRKVRKLFTFKVCNLLIAYSDICTNICFKIKRHEHFVFCVQSYNISFNVLSLLIYVLSDKRNVSEPNIVKETEWNRDINFNCEINCLFASIFVHVTRSESNEIHEKWITCETWKFWN